MRNIKNTRKCKGCFQSILKTNENIQEKKYIQLSVDKKEYEKEKIGSNNIINKNRLVISEKLDIQGMGRTIYLCRNEECIEKAIRRRAIERYYNISLKEEEKEELKKYAKK